MDELLTTEKVSWVGADNIVETYLSDVLPSVVDCASSYAFVFKNGKLLQTDLREGERPNRILDIPGGHVDKDESPAEAAIRETFEETGVVVRVIRLVAYKKITLLGEKPEKYRYPYPTGYMAFYLCEYISESEFHGNEDTHGRVWLDPEEFEKSAWCVHNAVLLDAIVCYC